MRAFLDSILAFIGAASLTDDEFATSTLTSQTYDQASYEFLAGILKEREAISEMSNRLVGYYRGRGVDVTVVSTGSSNIFVGSVL